MAEHLKYKLINAYVHDERENHTPASVTELKSLANGLTTMLEQYSNKIYELETRIEELEKQG